MYHKGFTGLWANTAAALLPKLEGELTRKHTSEPFPRPDAPHTGNFINLTYIWGVPPAGGPVVPKQDDGTSQIKVNPTKVRQQMKFPVVMKLNG